jgi:hypothetical protein
MDIMCNISGHISYASFKLLTEEVLAISTDKYYPITGIILEGSFGQMASLPLKRSLILKLIGQLLYIMADRSIAKLLKLCCNRIFFLYSGPLFKMAKIILGNIAFSFTNIHPHLMSNDLKL